MSRPSSGMTLDELRDEYDWMYEFQSRMAGRIRDDADVHNLADYVTKLEAENAKLRELLSAYWKGTHLHITSNVERDYLSEMRELGIEV